jgi:anti-sigma B factor antagonist
MSTLIGHAEAWLIELRPQRTFPQPCRSITAARSAAPADPCRAFDTGLLSRQCCIAAHVANGPVVAAGIHGPGARFEGRRELNFMATQRRIKVTDSGKITIVTFIDSKIIDEAEIQEFGQELYDLVEREGKKKIVLNFGNVEFLSSAALGKLIGFDKRVKQHGAELVLSNIRPEIYEVFAITKLTKLFVIKDDEADALAAI